MQPTIQPVATDPLASPEPTTSQITPKVETKSQISPKVEANPETVSNTLFVYTSPSWCC